MNGVFEGNKYDFGKNHMHGKNWLEKGLSLSFCIVENSFSLYEKSSGIDM